MPVQNVRGASAATLRATPDRDADTAPARTDSYLRFALLCHQRSGSAALDAWLISHPQIGLYGQLFNNSPEYRASHAGDLGLPLFRPHPESIRHFGLSPPPGARLNQLRQKFARHERVLDDYMSAFWSRFTQGQAYRSAGFKLHDYQLDDADLARLFDRHLDAVVLLSRRNLLKAAVAWAYDMRTRGRISRDALDERPVLQLNAREVAWFIEKTARHIDSWRRTLVSSGIPWLDLEYESVIEQQNTAGLLTFLNVEPHQDQQAPDPSDGHDDYAHVSNAAALDAELGNERTGRLY